MLRRGLRRVTFTKADQLGPKRKQKRPGRLTGAPLDAVKVEVWRRAGGEEEGGEEEEGTDAPEDVVTGRPVPKEIVMPVRPEKTPEDAFLAEADKMADTDDDAPSPLAGNDDNTSERPNEEESDDGEKPAEDDSFKAWGGN